MVNMSTDSLLTDMTSTPVMERIFSATEQVQCMLRFEAALSSALEDCGLTPAGSSAPLQALLSVDFLTPERRDYLTASARDSGNLAIPFIKLLTDEVRRSSELAARYVHMGATSQDVLDTALVLQLKEAVENIQRGIEQLKSACVSFTIEYAATIMPGRTWLQQGPPVTLGLKAAGWAAALSRHQTRIAQMSSRALLLQFGGAVGTLASLGTDGLRVSAALARHLDLSEALLPWHAHRDNIAEAATALGLLTGTLGKIARDISLLMQTEVAEVFEPSGEGRGGSSTMPHKRNPVAAASILAAAIRAPGLVATMLTAMPQEHERGLGGWQAEWETLPAIFRLTAGALALCNETVTGLEVHPEAMRANIAATHGLTLAEAVGSALTPDVGKQRAHQLVEEASREALQKCVPLQDILAANSSITQYLSAEKIAVLLDPRNYLGSTTKFIERSLGQATERED
jgi:3-carboxy-cis,cis-muconate cycloisomerase